jgi:hypothetical protein
MRALLNFLAIIWLLLALKVNILLQMLRYIIHTSEKNIFGLE